MRRKTLWRLKPKPFELGKQPKWLTLFRNKVKLYWKIIQFKAESTSLLLLQVVSGYGERPSWVFGWTLAFWLIFALIYYVGQGTWLGNGYGVALLLSRENVRVKRSAKMSVKL